MDMSLLIFLGISLALVAVMKKTRTSSLIALFAAGVVAGPHALGLYQSGGANLYYMGSMFLWFALGLELNIRRLWTMRKGIFGLGAAEVAVVAALMFPILFGISDWTVMGTAMVCLILAMSSSGADLQTLADRNELQTRLGRKAFSILLFQNLLTIPILAMLPVFAGKTLNLGAEMIDVGVLTIGLVLGVVIFAKLVMNPLMKIVAKLKSREAFILAVIFSIAACAAAFDALGLPMAVGAFLAGMLFSETLYSHQVRADMAPYQMLFVGLFFITLGIGLDLPLLIRNVWLILGGALGLMAIKFAGIYLVARTRGTSGRDSFLMAMLLAQGGEFGLLVLATLRNADIESIPDAHAEILIAAIIVSMVLTPIILWAYDTLGARGLLYSQRLSQKYEGYKKRKPAVIICGFGRVGMTVAKMLAAKNIPYIAIDMNVDRVAGGRDAGFDVVYGDTTRGDVLSGFGLAPRTTKAVIVALDNAAVAKKTVRASKRIAKSVKIFARARNLAESKILLSEGARVALPETIESSFILGQGVMAEMGVLEDDIVKIMSKMRQNNYETVDE